MSLNLHTNHLQAIQAHAERTYPDECCGLLLGTLTADESTVRDVCDAPNAWDRESATELNNQGFTKARRYGIAPEVMLSVMREARRRHLEIIGVYHSHPDYPAVPSECDRLLAWSQYSYLIVSVEQGTAKDCRSWTLNEQHQFEPEDIQMAEPSRM